MVLNAVLLANNFLLHIYYIHVIVDSNYRKEFLSKQLSKLNLYEDENNKHDIFNFESFNCKLFNS